MAHLKITRVVLFLASSRLLDSLTAPSRQGVLVLPVGRIQDLVLLLPRV